MIDLTLASGCVLEYSPLRRGLLHQRFNLIYFLSRLGVVITILTYVVMDLLF